MTKTLLAFILLFSSISHAETVKGILSKTGEGEIILTSIEEGREISRILEMAPQFRYTLDSKMLNSPNYVLEFEGKITPDRIVTSRTPTIIAGKDSVSGRLIRDEVGKYYINDLKVRFGRTKPIYGIPFDGQSKESYLGKNVIAGGFLSEEGGQRIFTINALLEKDLISVNGPGLYPAPAEFLENPKAFILDEMPKNIHSQGTRPWSGKLFEKKGYVPNVGEGVLIITLSGRQGDAPGASAGHFAFGGGIVAEDGSIKGETYNFYFEGPKEVLAGNTDLVSYFGHLIQGQQNYRPTFTLYAYGVKPEDLKKARDLYESELHKVRTEKGLEITPGYNCTTTSNYVMREIGIYGSHHNLRSRVLDAQNFGYANPLSWWSNNTSGEGVVGGLQVLSYVSTRDPEHYVPRAALESFVKNFSNSRWNKRKGIKRVDYIYIPQTPSRRQVGGMSYDQPIKEGKKILDYDAKRNEKISEINKAHEIILDKDKHSDFEVEEAIRLIQKDQAEVKALLDTID